jgi:hypothetical protein
VTAPGTPTELGDAMRGKARDWPRERTAADNARERLATERAQGLVSVGLFDGRAYVDAEPVGLLAEIARITDGGDNPRDDWWL